MSQGFGNLHTSQKNQGSGSPFPAGSANDGLRVDPISGKIVLGEPPGTAGNPSKFLANKEFQLNGFSYKIRDGIPIYFGINPTTKLYELGDISATSNGVIFVADDGSNQAKITSKINGVIATTALLIDGSLGQFEFGDVSNVENGMKILIDDPTKRFFISDSGANYFNIDATNLTTNWNVIGMSTSMDSVNQTFFVSDGSGNPYISIDIAGDAYSIGDIAGATSGTFFFLDSRSFEIDAANNRMISGDKVSGNYFFGDVDNFKNGTVFKILDATRAIAMGDANSHHNGTSLGVDDINNRITISNTGLNAIVRINNVNGFTGTVSPVVSITVNGGIVTNVT